MLWTRHWPEEPGVYWFYGWSTVGIRNDPPRFYFVHVHRTGNGKLVYVNGGHFMYKEEGAEGYWLPVQLPAPPEF